MDDDEMLDRFSAHAEALEENCGFNCLSTAQRVVLLTERAAGVIGNGGFRYFFEQGLDTEACARSFEELGLANIAELLRLAESVFPYGERHISEEANQPTESQEEMLNALAMSVCEELGLTFRSPNEGRLAKCLSAYINGNGR